MVGELALVGETGADGDLRQRKVASLKESLGPFNAAHNDVLVRRQSGGHLELPREVVDAEVGGRRHLLQGRAAIEVFLDVLDDRAKLPGREPAVRPNCRGAGAGGVADQVDGQDVGQRLGGERTPGGVSHQLVIHRQHRAAELWEVQAVERRQRQLRWVEAERLGRYPPDQPRLQEDMQFLLAPARAHPTRAAGRHQRDRSGGRRYVPLHPLIPQIQFFWWAGEKEEPVVGQGGQVEFKGGRRPAASRIQADPPQPVARRGRLVGEEPEPVQRPDRLGPPWPLLSYDCLPQEMACIRRKGPNPAR